MLWNRKAAITFFALWLVCPAVNAQSTEIRTETTTGSSAVMTPDDTVRNILMELETAIASKSVDNTIALFAEDAVFIDQAGDEICGRKALHQRFDQLFKADSGRVIGIHPQSISFPTDNVALIRGEVSRKLEQEDLPVSRFSMVMAKKNSGWLVNEITETAMKSAQTESHLQELNWMIGRWSASKPDDSAELNIEWAPSKKFILSKCTLSKQTMQPQIDTQVIGWDPQHNSIISWHFDCNGGFGNGAWHKQPNEEKWTVEVAGVSADGSDTTASKIFTLKNRDEFVWQSTHRSLDGAVVGDTEAITVRRVKP